MSEHEEELRERDRQIDELYDANSKLEDQVDQLEEERDKYKAALDEIEDAVRRVL